MAKVPVMRVLFCNFSMGAGLVGSFAGRNDSRELSPIEGFGRVGGDGRFHGRFFQIPPRWRLGL
jgi:hypothetical protein